MLCNAISWHTQTEVESWGITVATHLKSNKGEILPPGYEGVNQSVDGKRIFWFGCRPQFECIVDWIWLTSLVPFILKEDVLMLLSLLSSTLYYTAVWQQYTEPKIFRMHSSLKRLHLLGVPSFRLLTPLSSTILYYHFEVIQPTSRSELTAEESQEVSEE